MKSQSAYYCATGVALIMVALLLVSRTTGTKDVEINSSEQALTMNPVNSMFLSEKARSGTVRKREHDDQIAKEMAAHYRTGEYDKVDFAVLAAYLRRRIGAISTAELKGLLGEPRTVVPGDNYYLYALATIYDDNGVEAPVGAQGQHDQVLHYSEFGPPEHRIPDESQNLFFVTNNNQIIAMRTLFP